MTNIGRRGVSAAKWSAASTVAVIALQMVAQVILARKLGPDIYGLFGIGLVVFGFSNFLATFGFGWSLQQLVELRDEDVRFAFTWQLVTGALTALALAILAPQLAAYFHDARLTMVLRWLALGCVLSAVTSPATNLLARDLNFRARGTVDVASYALGYIGVGVPLALTGAGVYSLVAAWLTQSVVKLAGTFAWRPHSVRPLFWYKGASTVFGVGSTVFVTNLGNWFLNNLDRLLIGRLLNSAAVGLYTVGYTVANRPNSLLIAALQPTFFSASARMQEEPHRLKRAYLHVIASIWVLVAPPFVFLSCIATDLVRVLYGSRWIGAGAPLAVLFLAMPLYVTWAMSTPVLWNTGRKQYEFLLQLPLLLIAVPVFYVVAPRGVYAAALVAAGLLAARGIVVATAAFRALGLHLSDVLPQVGRGALLSALAASGAWCGGHLASQLIIGSEFRTLLASLVSGCCVSLVFVLGVVRAWPAVVGAQAGAVVVRFVPNLEGLFRQAVVVTPAPSGSLPNG